MSTKATKINNVTIEPVKLTDTVDPTTIRGYDYIPGLYPNIDICAKKRSGKTNVIFNLLRALTNDLKTYPDDPATKVYFFVSTIYRDKTYQAIKDMLDERNVPHESFADIMDDDNNSLIAVALEQPIETAQANLKTVKTVTMGPDGSSIVRTEQRTGPKHKQGPKQLAPEKIFVFDDLGKRMRSPLIGQLLKTNAHYKLTNILSHQWATDLEPESLKQVDFALLFKSFSKEKLKDLRELLDLAVEQSDFQRLYDYATQEPYSFLFIDVRHDKFRRNFDTALE